MDISQIRKLIRLVKDSDVTEIEVTEGESTVRITRQGHGAAQMAQPQPMQVAAPQPATSAPQPAEAPAEASKPAEESEHVVHSPMVGTFYRAPAPDADPFVTEGARVKKGEILCIIEAMKLMNEIEAEYDGVVEKVLAENASPVEYNQPLFVIKPL